MQLTSDVALMESIADDAVAVSPSPISPLTIYDAIQKSKSPDDLIKRMQELCKDTNLEFRQLIESAMFLANVVGYVASETRLGD